MGKPTLLVVVPTLGERLDYLERALHSCADLNGWVDYSIAVVTPSSASSARKLASRFGATVVDDPGRGMAAAVNRAVFAHKSHDFYVWLGDDDELVPRGVVALVEELLNSPLAVVAYGNCDYIDGEGEVIASNKAGKLAAQIVSWGPNLIPHPGTVVRLKSFIEIGGLDESLRYVMDLDMFLRLKSRGEFLAAPVVSARFRWHPESLTVSDRSGSLREASEVKNRYLPIRMRAMSWLWNIPVALLTVVASAAIEALISQRVSRLR